MSEMDASGDTRETANPPPSLAGLAGPDLSTFLPKAPAAAQAHLESQPGLALLMQELEQERQRIAMDLHDGLGPLITLIKLELHNARLLMDTRPGELDLAHAAIERAEANIARTFDELRRTVLDLRPAMLDDLGVVHALRWLIRQFSLSGTDVLIETRLPADDSAVPGALKIAIFRICQEALNNVIKHAHASHVTVALDVTEGELRLSIADDGSGIKVPADIFNRSGGGLAGIARRAKSSHGILAVDSADGSGTRIVIRWPLPHGGDLPESLGSDGPLASIISY